MQTLNNLITEYLNYCQLNKKLDNKTIKAYKIDLTQFYSIIPNHELPITKNTLMFYLSQIHQQYKPRTIKRKIASVKAFFHYMEYEEIIKVNPFNKIDLSFRQPKLLPRSIPSSTIQLFLSKIYEETSSAKTPFEKKK